MPINEEIRFPEVRLIDSEGEQKGVVSLSDAQNMANDKELDLVLISPNAKPPVCRIMNYGKFKFEQAKREREAKKKQHIVELKEIRLGLKIDSGDLETRIRHAKRFIDDGNKIKVSIRFRGRELGHPKIGYQVMERFAEACKDFAQIERPAKMDGRQMLMFVAPIAEK